MSSQCKLLEGLAGPGITVTVRSLAKYMASSGVIVTPHVGRRRGYIPLSAQAYGLDIKSLSEKGGEFYGGRVTNGHLCFIPRADEAELAVLEKRLRRAVEARSLSESFMPVSAYESLKAEFEEIRTAYFNKRDEIVSRWQYLVADFKVGAKEMLADIDMPAEVRAALLKEFINGVPSSQAYENSFSMDLYVHAFPAECQSEGLERSLAADVKETWKNDVVSTAITAIETSIGTAWSASLTAMSQYLSNGTIRKPTLQRLQKIGTELSWKNVFRNPLLCKLSRILGGLDPEGDIDALAETIESAVVRIFAYAQESGVELDHEGSPYTKQQLESMLAVEGMVAKGA